MLHHTFEFKSKKINYQDEGKAETTLVLLHGYMNSLEVWKYFVLEYMNYMRVITIDLIGHGDSETIEDVSSMELQAEMVKSLLDSLNVRHCVMCGHSMGGMITLAFAEKYSNMLKGYCLMNSQALADTEKGKQNRLKACALIDQDRIKFIVDFIPNLFAKDNRTRYVSEIEELKSIAMNTCKEGVIAAQRGMIGRHDMCKVLSESSCPVLFITGRYDVRIDLETLFAQACLPKHCEVMVLDSGHMAFIEEELKVKIRLRDFTNMCFGF
ncbi:MAG: alpha/beta fold hydrolase [Bacteroidales bacterium]